MQLPLEKSWNYTNGHKTTSLFNDVVLKLVIKGTGGARQI